MFDKKGKPLKAKDAAKMALENKEVQEKLQKILKLIEEAAKNGSSWVDSNILIPIILKRELTRLGYKITGRTINW